MKLVLDWLEASYTAHPQKLAVRDPHTQLTYAELVYLALHAAHTLVSYDGARPQRAVAFYLEKSAYALAAMLGAVYAGDFYSVLDTRQPAVRTRACIETLDPYVLVVADELYDHACEMCQDSELHIVKLSCLLGIGSDTSECAIQKDALLRGLAHEDLEAYISSLDSALFDIRTKMCDTDPLYVNFTSGSTGTPKGVVIAHRSVMDFIPIFTSTFGMDETDNFANQAPFDFDVSVKDIYASLYLGACLCIIPREYFSVPTQLMDYLTDISATNLTWAVSALCFVSIMNGLEYKCPSTLRRVLFSGEVMPPKQLAKWQKHLPHTRFVNLYGPTEITCNCAYYEVTRTYAKDEIIPMGKAFSNERIILLDEDNSEVSAPLCVGELCVVGTCVGAGYLGDTSKTSSVFVQNPLNTRWIEPMYRTGDMAYYNEEQELVYAGRKDFQIKHMGHRLELGDIEAQVTSIDGVEQTACVYDTKKHRLHLFYVGTCEKEELVAALHKLLPSFMIPNTCVKLACMPLTKNGKIDRRTLLEEA